MKDAEQLTRDALLAMGFRVEAIPEADGKRADFRATDGDSTYLVEVKHKLDDPELLRDHATRMARGEVVTRAELTGHKNRISAILKNGREQLDNTPGASNAYRLIWFHADGIDRDLRWKQAFSTFYGRVYLWPKEPPGECVVECYYFDYSAAWSIPSVDGMILSDAHRVQLCLNEFSGSINGLCTTSLHERFANHNAVVDPRKLVARGDVLACRSEVPRGDDDEVLEDLREQTGVLYAVIRFSQHSASVMVPPNAP